MPAKESDSRLPRQHFSPETAQSSQYTAPPRIRDCERFHQDVVIGRAAALDPVAPWNRILQIGPEQFKIDNPVQLLKIVALGGEVLQTLVDIEKPRLPDHPQS